MSLPIRPGSGLEVEKHLAATAKMNMSSDQSIVRYTLTPPEYFESIRARSESRWTQLEADDELAGPWRQLFLQIQSPRHVLSELLQNADDAGAKRAWVKIHNNTFVFQHDGSDFTEEQLSSLCRFGFSNKRNLHTIGFRGIGFKSTFSLGDLVEVRTQTLAIRFNKKRFTLPEWIIDAQPAERTTITVTLQDTNRAADLQRNLAEWVNSPASLLFFCNLDELTIDNVSLKKTPLGNGPVEHSERFSLQSPGKATELILFQSAEEDFPEDVVREIREERNAEDLHLKSCKVEIVIGIPDNQRLFVVLPTGVILDAPFSCNAPFLQDPARMAIKSPSTSPTNRWLLQRAGRLASAALRGWLGNDSLSLEHRAAAYELLPSYAHSVGDSVAALVNTMLCQSIASDLNNTSLLLSETGELVTQQYCLAPPLDLYGIWPTSALLKLLDAQASHCLTADVSNEHRKRLIAWKLLTPTTVAHVIERLSSNKQVPTTDSHLKTQQLWNFVQANIKDDYGGLRRRRIALVPILRYESLIAAEHAVRLPKSSNSINEHASIELNRWLHVIDEKWLDFLEGSNQSDSRQQHAIQLLRDLDLHRPYTNDEMVERACRKLSLEPTFNLKDCVAIAHLMAFLDAKTPESISWVSRDGQMRKATWNMLSSQSDPLLPDHWAEQHQLHPQYFQSSALCPAIKFKEWAISEKSRLLPFAPLIQSSEVFSSRYEVEQFLESRQCPVPKTYPYRRGSFMSEDYDFDQDLLQHWNETAKADKSIWQNVLQRLLNASPVYWQNHTHAKLLQYGNRYSMQANEKPMPAAWIMRFRALPCILDGYGKLALPAELYLRTPGTEPLQSVEPFVRADFDREKNQPLLKLLGVRDTPSGFDKLLERIRTFTAAPLPDRLLPEIVKWYTALDKALGRLDSTDFNMVRHSFHTERLILTKSGEWASVREVFTNPNPEEVADTPVIHPAAMGFVMWDRLGVAEKPSFELHLDWLNSLPKNKPVDGMSLRRLRAILQRYAQQVWQKCEHWLTLDNVWTPVQQLRYRLTMSGLTKWSDFHPGIKARTANLQMITAAHYEQDPFSRLADIGNAIELRLATLPRTNVDPEQPAWLTTLAELFQRIVLPVELDTIRVRNAAERLHQTFVQVVPTISVTPFLDGEPAGLPFSPEALWHEHRIYHSGKLTKSFDAVVQELSKPFAHEQVKESIKVCCHRDSAFIREYLNEHFNFDTQKWVPQSLAIETPDAVNKPIASAPVTNTPQPDQLREVPAEINNTEACIESSAHCELTKNPTQPMPRSITLFEKYVRERGYLWDGNRNRYVHDDQSWFGKSDNPFHWEYHQANGTCAIKYWTSNESLSRNGIEIPAELWQLLVQHLESTAIIMANAQGAPKAFTGSEIKNLVETKRWTLFPAKYRIRMELT